MGDELFFQHTHTLSSTLVSLVSPSSNVRGGAGMCQRTLFLKRLTAFLLHFFYNPKKCKRNVKEQKAKGRCWVLLFSKQMNVV